MSRHFQFQVDMRLAESKAQFDELLGPEFGRLPAGFCHGFNRDERNKKTTGN